MQQSKLAHTLFHFAETVDGIDDLKEGARMT